MTGSREQGTGNRDDQDRELAETVRETGASPEIVVLIRDKGNPDDAGYVIALEGTVS